MIKSSGIRTKHLRTRVLHLQCYMVRRAHTRTAKSRACSSSCCALSLSHRIVQYKKNCHYLLASNMRICQNCTKKVVLNFSVSNSEIYHRRLLQFVFSILSSGTDIDDCASHPCKNNGTCTDRVNGFNCSCAPGFNGTRCETCNSCL